MHLPRRIPLRPSPRLAMLLAVAHVAAAGALWAAALPAPLSLGGSLLVLYSLWHGIRRHALRRDRRAPAELEIGNDGALCVRARTGEWTEMTASPASTLLPGLAVILCRAKGGGRGQTIVVFPDALSRDDWRSLRVWLRWRAARPSAEKR
ncbi:MAG: protein YgfX [Pseudomonadota bacterium]|jgi:toxin CptA